MSLLALTVTEGFSLAIKSFTFLSTEVFISPKVTAICFIISFYLRILVSTDLNSKSRSLIAGLRMQIILFIFYLLFFSPGFLWRIINGWKIGMSFSFIYPTETPQTKFVQLRTLIWHIFIFKQITISCIIFSIYLNKNSYISFS